MCIAQPKTQTFRLWVKTYLLAKLCPLPFPHLFGKTSFRLPCLEIFADLLIQTILAALKVDSNVSTFCLPTIFPTSTLPNLAPPEMLPTATTTTNQNLRLFLGNFLFAWRCHCHLFQFHSVEGRRIPSQRRRRNDKSPINGTQAHKFSQPAAAMFAISRICISTGCAFQEIVLMMEQTAPTRKSIFRLGCFLP